jgi:hypothetical protein
VRGGVTGRVVERGELTDLRLSCVAHLLTFPPVATTFLFALPPFASSQEKATQLTVRG